MSAIVPKKPIIERFRLKYPTEHYLPKKPLGDPYSMFWQHRARSKANGIAWALTFEQWIRIWYQSGQMYKRGTRRGDYCVARIDTTGAFEVGNVEIVPIEEHWKRNRGQWHSPETRQIHSKAMKGAAYLKAPKTEEHKRKISEGLRRYHHAV